MSGPNSITAAEQAIVRPPTGGYAQPPPAGPRGGASYALPGARTPPPRVEEDDEDRTVQATAAQQAAAHASYGDYDDDDGDATIVSRAAPSDMIPSSGLGPPAPGPIVPAAGAPPPAARPPATRPLTPTQPPPPPRAGGAGGRTLPLNAVAPHQLSVPTRPDVQPLPLPPPPPRSAPMLGNMGGNQGNQFGGPGVPPGFNIVDPSLPGPGNFGPVGQTPPPAPYGGQPWGMPAGPPPTYGPPPQLGGPPQGPPPFGVQNSGYAPSPYGGPGYPGGASPLAATAGLPLDARGPREVIRPKRIPAWAVAVASGVFALFFAGGLVLNIRASPLARQAGGAGRTGCSRKKQRGRGRHRTELRQDRGDARFQRGTRRPVLRGPRRVPGGGDPTPHHGHPLADRHRAGGRRGPAPHLQSRADGRRCGASPCSPTRGGRGSLAGCDGAARAAAATRGRGADTHVRTAAADAKVPTGYPGPRARGRRRRPWLP